MGFVWKFSLPLSVHTCNEHHIAQLLVSVVRFHLFECVLGMLQAGKELILAAGARSEAGEAGIAVQ